MRFAFNERKTAQAAAHLLKLSGGVLPYMHLIKLLFLADRATLLKHGQPITGAWMVSMHHGPVLSEVLDLINGEGNRDGAWVATIGPAQGYDVALKVPEPEMDELSRFELKVLAAVYERYGRMNMWDLVNWLHDNIPEWKDPGRSMSGIAFEDVLRANRVSEEEIAGIDAEAESAWKVASLRR